MTSGAQASTFYNIWDSKNNPYRVFCDLASEPGWAWTLVMSQSFRNRKMKQLMGVPLYKDASLNERNPNWGAYRLSLRHMGELRVMSSHWRITCNFPTDVFDYRDYVRGNFSQVDLLNFHGHNACQMVDYMNVKGRNCSQCYAAWWQDGDTMFHHDLSLENASLKPMQILSSTRTILDGTKTSTARFLVVLMIVVAQTIGLEDAYKPFRASYT